MAPALADGDYAVAVPVGSADDIVPGDVVEVDHPNYGPIVKRIEAIDAGYVRLCGDTVRSAGSDQIGRIPRSRLVARLVWRIAPTGIFRIGNRR